MFSWGFWVSYMQQLVVGVVREISKPDEIVVQDAESGEV